MYPWLSFEQVSARHLERIREAERARLVHALGRAHPAPPLPLARLAGSALTATGAWLTAVGCRLQTEADGAPCYEAVAPLPAE